MTHVMPVFYFCVSAMVVFKNNIAFCEIININNVQKVIQAIFFLMPSIVFATVLSQSNVVFQKESNEGGTGGFVYNMTMGSEGNLGVITFGPMSLSNSYLTFTSNPDVDGPQVLLMATSHLYMSKCGIGTNNRNDNLFIPIIASPDITLDNTTFSRNGVAKSKTSLMFLEGTPSAVLQQATQIADTAPIFQSDLADQDGISTVSSSQQSYGNLELNFISNTSNVFVSANDPIPLLGLESLANDTAAIADTPSNPNMGESSPNMDVSDVESDPDLILEDGEVKAEHDDEVKNLDEEEEEDDLEDTENIERMPQDEGENDALPPSSPALEEQNSEMTAVEEPDLVVEEPVLVVEEVVEIPTILPEEVLPDPEGFVQDEDGLPLSIENNIGYLDELEGSGAEVSEELVKLKEESQSVKALQRGQSGVRRSLVLLKER